MTPSPTATESDAGSEATREAAAPESRPRVEGERELEILQAALEVLSETGYDRLTMDAVATAARASKATLYRRWKSKTDLVIEALVATKGGPGLIPDTGTLRGDLIEMFCGIDGLTDASALSTFTALITAMHRDPEFAAAWREQFLVPKMTASQTVFERARQRGEIRPDADLALIGPALAGIVLHRVIMLGDHPDATLVSRVVDQIILPACGNAQEGAAT